jgi:UDP-N-acetylglucosamine 2-epimerase (non-hydrolysing)
VQAHTKLCLSNESSSSRARLSVAVIVGTRPQIIKSAPVVYEARRQRMKLVVINTGQHYDANLSESFLEELSYRTKVRNLEIGNETEHRQLSRIVKCLRSFCERSSLH